MSIYKGHSGPFRQRQHITGDGRYLRWHVECARCGKIVCQSPASKAVPTIDLQVAGETVRKKRPLKKVFSSLS